MRETKLEGRIYKELETSDEATRWAEQNYSNILSMDLNSLLRRSIRSYTGSCSDNWNACLRNSPPIELNQFSARAIEIFGDDLVEIKAINDFLHQNSIPENMVVFRYTKMRDIRRLCNSRWIKSKMHFADKAFFSTTLVKDLLKSFISQKHYNCILKLYLPQSLHGAYVSFKDELSLLNEQEILLPCNTEFEILKIHRVRFPVLIECKAIIK